MGPAAKEERMAKKLLPVSAFMAFAAGEVFARVPFVL